MPASLCEVLGGLVLLSLALIPTGLSIGRVIELLLRHTFSLTPVERAILALYATGFLFFLLASIPIPIYGSALVATTLILGTAFYACLLGRKGAAGLRSALRIVTQPAFLLLAGGTLGLLLFETVPVWNHPFPNAWDGSATALWTNLILRQGTIPTSLQPFANAPVLYPMGASVWMTLPVLVLGWPLVQTPVLLPPLFLSLTIPAAYAWGARWCRGTPVSGTSVGLVFATFFGVVASWPRLYTGGWYDFTLALPLLLVIIGFLPAWSGRTRPNWRTVIGFGLVCGALTTLSLAAGEAVIVLLLAYTLVRQRGDLRDLSVRIIQIACLVLFEMLSTARSLVEWSISYGTTYVPSSQYGGLNLRLIQGELDPFVLWKAKMSPFPAISLELQVLLAIGLILAVVLVLRRGEEADPSIARSLSGFLLVGTVAASLMTAFLLFTALAGGVWVQLRSVTNLGQSSIVLFIFFEGVALLPLTVACSSLQRRGATPASSTSSDPSTDRFARSPKQCRRLPPGAVRMGGLIAIVILVVPLTLGAVTTVIEGPAYIQGNVGKTSNVTSGDVAALEWASAHLPACSLVLVAPGSAAQFLPEYVTVRIAFPMNPVPNNGSYQVAVANLTEGVYSSATRSALVVLGVTEVFVTGQTSVSYLPFSPQPIESSSDFSLLFASGDAGIFAFLPVLATSQCPG